MSPSVRMGVSAFWIAVHSICIPRDAHARNRWQRLGCCFQSSPLHWSSACASAIVEQPRWAIACDMSSILACRRSSSKHMYRFIRLMVSLVMLALASGVPKPPSLRPAQNVTSSKLTLTFHTFLKARIHKFSNLSIHFESQFAMAAEHLKIGIMATCTTQWICWGWNVCLVNCLMVSSVLT